MDENRSPRIAGLITSCALGVVGFAVGGAAFAAAADSAASADNQRSDRTSRPRCAGCESSGAAANGDWLMRVGNPGPPREYGVTFKRNYQ